MVGDNEEIDINPNEWCGFLKIPWVHNMLSRISTKIEQRYITIPCLRDFLQIKQCLFFEVIDVILFPPSKFKHPVTSCVRIWFLHSTMHILHPGDGYLDILVFLTIIEVGWSPNMRRHLFKVCSRFFYIVLGHHFVLVPQTISLRALLPLQTLFKSTGLTSRWWSH